MHRKWDDATAVLAGDALQTLAFELCTDPVLGSAEARVALVAALAKASGAEGMVYGQALDIAAETAAEPLSLEAIIKLQAGKTGARYCLILGESELAAGTVVLKNMQDGTQQTISQDTLLHTIAS